MGERNGHMELLKLYGNIGDYKTLYEMGIEEAQLRAETKMLSVNGISYSCIYSHPESGWEDMDSVLMVQMLPIVTTSLKSLSRALAISYAMLLIFFTTIVYLFSVKRSVVETANRRAVTAPADCATGWEAP